MHGEEEAPVNQSPHFVDPDNELLIPDTGRLRLLWGLTSILVIVWLLATSSSDAEALAMLNVEHPKRRR